MARSYAQISIDLWSRDEWRALSRSAQLLYLFLLSHPTTNFAGVTDWRTNRLRAFAADWSEEDLYRAALELASARLLVVDVELEEAMVLGYIDGQGLLKQPRLAVSIVKAYASIVSPTIRGVVVSELRRTMAAQPTLTCWTDARMLRLLEHPSVDIEDVNPDFGVPSGVVSGVFAPNDDRRLGVA